MRYGLTYCNCVVPGLGADPLPPLEALRQICLGNEKITGITWNDSQQSCTKIVPGGPADPTGRLGAGIGVAGFPWLAVGGGVLFGLALLWWSAPREWGTR